MKKYYRKHAGYFVQFIFFITVATIFAVRVQYLKGNVLDIVLSVDFSEAVLAGVRLLLAILCEIVFYFFYDLAKSRLIASAMRDLRGDYLRSLIMKPYRMFRLKTEGEYLAQYSKELDTLEQDYFATWPMLLAVLLKILIVGGSLFYLDVQIALITFLLLTMPLYVPKLIEKNLQSAQKEHLSTFEAHLKKLNDWLRGFELIKHFRIEATITKKFDETNQELCEADWQKRKINEISRSLSAILSYLSHFFILAFASYLVTQGRFTAGQFFIAIGMIDQLSYPIISISSFIQSLVAIKPIKEKTENLLACQNQEEGEVSISPANFKNLSFQDLTYGYDDRILFEKLDWSFDKNKKYLIQGSSGSGKTSIINLILNYYKPKDGRILLNRIPVNECKNLSQLITLMRQDAVLFTDSLRNNLTMYQEIADEKCLAVLETVGLDHFANPERLEQEIQPDGSNLSGGEKKRICLARSLLNKSPILILDEPLANLDAINVGQIEDLILGIADRTVIVISHQFDDGKRDGFDICYSLGKNY